MLFPISVPSVLGVLLLMVLAIAGPQMLFAYISGWRRLAERYRAGQRFTGERWRDHAAGMSCASTWWAMRGVEYESSLAIGADASGLHLSASLLGHPPLFVPWREIDVAEERRNAFGPSPTYGIRFKNVPGVALANVSPGLFEKLKTAAGTAWPVRGDQ